MTTLKREYQIRSDYGYATKWKLRGGRFESSIATNQLTMEDTCIYWSTIETHCWRKSDRIRQDNPLDHKL